MQLDLRTSEEPLVRKELGEGTVVRLHSDRLDCDLDVSITHREPEPGGTVQKSLDTPYLDIGDHVHFEWGNVLEILE